MIVASIPLFLLNFLSLLYFKENVSNFEHGRIFSGALLRILFSEGTFSHSFISCKQKKNLYFKKMMKSSKRYDAIKYDTIKWKVLH